MSPCERTAWIRLASLLLVFVPYFVHVLDVLPRPNGVARPLLVAFVGAAVLHVVLTAALQAVARVAFGRAEPDERDAAIEARSLRVAYFALLATALTAFSIIAMLGVLQRPSDAGTILLPTFSTASQFVVFCIVAAEALRHATQVVSYRVGTVA